MKTLNEYKDLILAMPVKEQAFTTNRTTWEKKIDSKILDEIFKGKSELKISRENVLTNCPLNIFIYYVIMWGYPRGMRGQANDAEIFKNINLISEIINKPKRNSLKEEDWESIRKSLSGIKGLGISTISKLLYFRTFKFGDFNALILDDRLLRVFQHGEFKEFEKLKNLKRTNAMSNYLYYLEIMHETAKEIGVSPENLEMFLFTFGNNLK
jgi:hypothetical protein